ncbi:MAG: gfo/Idh/MocA family oxidoreductase [Deltaproteobacteria bacterium]|jgi:predicted dehydrogenase|nr:MAG: gfo/Idh/MocA family oxidoreductase [Deltaproteobacteria bacterium]
MKKIRVGVVGVGYLGQYHAEKYSKLSGVNLVGVVDINHARALEIADRFNTRAFFDYSDLFDEVQAVSIAVPTKLHYRVAGDFFSNGIDILLEKPIATTVAEADTLIEMAEKKNLIFQVGHLERYNSAIVAIQDVLNNPMFIESHRLSFFTERATDVDVVLDLMIHDLDIILSIVNSDIDTIDAVGVPVISPKIDIANARITFVNGCVANITASRVSEKTMRKIRIFQPDAYISIDFLSREVDVYNKIENGEENGGLPKIVASNVEINARDSLEEEIKSFIDSVNTRKPPLVSGTDAKRALSVALRILEQIDRLRRIYDDSYG